MAQVFRSGMRIRNHRAPELQGTIACVVVSRTNSDERYLLTAGHVLSANGYGKAGDAIEASVDGARWSKVGEFARTTLLRDAEGVTQACDAGLARITDAQAVAEGLGDGGTIVGIATGLYAGQPLRFSGAVSGAARPARLITTRMSVPVSYVDLDGAGTFSLQFDNQVLYGPPDEVAPATRYGDSGALVLTTDNEAVGLHISVTPSDFSVAASVCTPICTVLETLGVRIAGIDDDCAVGQAAGPPGAGQVADGGAASRKESASRQALALFDLPIRGLLDLHSCAGPLQWQLAREGLIVDGRLDRSAGALVTVPRVWSAQRNHITQAAREFKVPVELIVATICVESAGNARAVRAEPGWTSDEATPHRVSAGLMQTLISTARSSLPGEVIDRHALMDPRLSIRAGTACIDMARARTRLDPPLVACAYNAGDLIDVGPGFNRWNLRQTGNHADRFVQWFNDCFAHFRADASAVPADAPSFYRLLNP